MAKLFEKQRRNFYYNWPSFIGDFLKSVLVCFLMGHSVFMLFFRRWRLRSYYRNDYSLQLAIDAMDLFGTSYRHSTSRTSGSGLIATFFSSVMRYRGVYALEREETQRRGRYLRSNV